MGRYCSGSITALISSDCDRFAANPDFSRSDISISRRASRRRRFHLYSKPAKTLFYNGGAGDMPAAQFRDLMPEARDLRSVIEAAEQAASAGDYATAELNLREAAALQETQLGPFHPDLANTLNNLGVIYERVDSPAEAELCYRRAYAIATKALAPDHPFVATSRKNLEDFCRARGRSFERSAVPRERAATRTPVGRSFRPVVVSAVGAVGFAMLVVAVLWFRSLEPDESSPASRTQTSPQRQEPTPERVPVEPNREPQGTATERNTSVPRDSDSSIVRDGGRSVAPESSSSATRESGTPATSAPVVVTIAEAQLCRRLSTSDWRCDPVSSPVEAGLLFFYTRVKASNNTTVEHRWYHEDRLLQSVELAIRANPVSGYRTYTRRTVSAENAGNWRVEVRTQDGSILHDERFVVR